MAEATPQPAALLPTLGGAPERLLVFGGIVLLLVNMFLGEVFAIFISHVANGEIRERWVDVIETARAGGIDALAAHFSRIDALLDYRGRIMNTHSHVGAFGMLALLFALLQPMLNLSGPTRLRLAFCLIAGGLIQSLFVFASHYAGTWAFLVSDLGALLVTVAIGGTLAGLLRAGEMTADDPSQSNMRLLLQVPAGLLLARGGALLILLGMLGGLVYAATFSFRHEPALFSALEAMLATVPDPGAADPRALVMDYRGLNSRIAILAAAHSHAIEMGILALLLAPAQTLLLLSDRARLLWARVFLVGAYLLPFFIFNATIYGLRSAAFADLSGLAVIVALLAMLTGLVRRTGADDVATSTHVGKC